MMSSGARVVVGVSGASGAALALECLRCLAETEVESCLVLSSNAELTINQELGMSVEEFSGHADRVFDNRNIGASIASGTFRTDGMIVAPCSMKTLSGVANGFSENLLLRAADVTLKEQRPLVLMVRESPLSAIHVDNMAKLARIPGVVLMPPLLTFYNEPTSVDDMVHHIVCKALQVFDIECSGFHRWS
ncbi:3-octaprenyl-4-hydroxybenzoate carboxy-lyase [Coriobacterium glomerans PW2]|uniref:Flavin prenyltransferase UbiX n=1 Tax=Coriobacterium glomerans (strain ATCC 49209 / DSM 20642 / JCM 10262 / PW2) TaxID=700015 RepID=F2N9Z6_CORGP|nr:UbiX family flavin prenyltransferase [Coriobacterium glomerans]AEB06251.1 3-octaprenyl-4-hydroxybenzoate carboxy-lyase [Coriobacterium glomerans PW2]